MTDLVEVLGGSGGGEAAEVAVEHSEGAVEQTPVACELAQSRHDFISSPTHLEN